MEETQEVNQAPAAADTNANGTAVPEERKCDFEATGRLRDEKGHFLPSQDKTCNHDKKPKKTRKQKEDANTVKIRIVKDDVPVPGKDFEGRLEDMKERTATNFIKAVRFHQPRAINIDGIRYYSQGVVDELKGKLAEEQATAERGLETLKKTMGALLKTGKTLEECFDSAQRVRKSRFIWRSIAIGTLAALISFGITVSIEKRNAAKAKAQAPVEQVQGTGTQDTAK